MRVILEGATYLEAENAIEVTFHDGVNEVVEAKVDFDKLNKFIKKIYPNELTIDSPTHEGEHKQLIVQHIHSAMEAIEMYCLDYIKAGEELIYKNDNDTQLF